VIERTRRFGSTATLAAMVWMSSLLAAFVASAGRLAARARRDEAGQEAITYAVAALFGILLIAFTYPLWKGVAQAVIDKITKMISDAT
jgi:hypothetical protein